MSEMRESINRRVDKTNKRIDTLYDLLGKIYKILIKQPHKDNNKSHHAHDPSPHNA
jgi:hypothetical protein